jgi:hypothetical protein
MRLVRSLGLAAVGLAAASCADYPPLPPVVASAPPAVRPAATAVADAYCREYQGTADIGGGPQTVYGTACQQPDGTWRLVDAAPAAAPPSVVQGAETVRYAPYPVYYPYGYPAPYYGPYYYGPRVSIGAAFAFGHGRHRW